jgi:hypothetical protein
MRTFAEPVAVVHDRADSVLSDVSLLCEAALLSTGKARGETPDRAAVIVGFGL